MQPVGGPHLHYDFSNDDDRLLARSLNRDHTPDPDAFYGPFISDELGQVDHAGLVVGHLPSTMAATSKRRPPPPTGPSTKSPAGVGRGAAASSARSASSPAPGAAKTTGVGATSTPRAAGQRTSQNSVKEIASRLNQNAGGSPGSPAQRNGRVRTGSSPKPPHSGRPTSRVADRYLNGNTTANSPHTPRTTPTPSSQHSATRSPRTLKKDSPSQTHAEAQRGSNSHEMSEVAGNRPLFGEVITGFMGDSKPGFGIEELECPSPYAGSMHQPNAMFPHNRSRSDGDPLPHYATPKRNSANERNTLIKKHRHSHSDLARIDAKTPLDVKGDSHLSPSSSQRTPTSRIPTKAGRPTSTEPVRPLPSSRSTSALDARRRTPTPSSERPSGKENRPGSRPITPQYLTSRRFDPHNPSAAKNNPSLKANIITSVPKASPPLRRTRDRQTVTREPPTRESVMTKGTAASRARAAERNASPAADRSRQRRHLQKRSPSRKRAQVQLESVDVAARREAIKAKLSQSSIKSKEAAAEEQGESQVAKMKSTEPVLEEVPEDESKESRTNPPALVLNVDNLPTQGDSEASTATTDFETDESPVVGSRGRASQLAPPEGYAFQIRRSARDSDALQKDLANHYGTPDVSDGSVRDGSLSTVDRNSIASSIDFAPGWQLPKAYEESINIMLGATPVPPSIPSFGEPGQRQNHTPAPNQYLVADPSNAPGHAPAGHMPVGDNQLSTAAVDGASPNFTPNKASSSENVMSRDVPRDTAAYSTIHRIFEHYHNSAYVSPETAHGFQQEMAKVSPYLAQHGNWTSRDATLRYLEGLMKASPVSDDNDSFPEYQSRQAGYGADLDPFRALDSTPNEEYTGVAMVYSPKVWGRDSGGDIWYTPPVEQQDSDKGAQDKHQTYKPTPPPKDVDAAEPDAVREDMSSTPKVSNFSRPRPSELEADGLGLTVPDSKLGAQHSQLGKVQALFDPPAPTYTPPPPPNEALRSPPSPSVYSRPPYSAAPPTSSTFGEEIHPLSREPTQSTLVGEDQLGGSTLNEGQPGSPSRPPSDKDDPSKALKERYFQLKELVDTESSFHQDMVVLEDIYKSTSTAVDITDEDRRILFGNSDRIVQFSKTFLDDIRRAVSPVYKPPRPNKWSTRRGSFSTVATEQTSTANSDTDSDRLTQDLKTTVGMVFRQHLANMEKVYTDYAKNHDAANTRLAKLLQQPDVKLWVDQCASQSRDLTTAWDLDSLIIKPTQRVLKYSLLLKDIFKNTVEDHPDRENIYIAKQELEAACTRINEATGRASLVRKVMNRDRKVSGAKLRIPKLLDTRTEKLRQQIGLSNAVDDPEYDAISQKFGGHFFQLQIVMRDVERYIDEVDQFGRRCDAFILSLEDFLQVEHTAFPEIESKWRKFSQIIRQINTVALKEHVSVLHTSIILLSSSSSSFLDVLSLKHHSHLIPLTAFSSHHLRPLIVSFSSSPSPHQHSSLHDRLFVAFFPL